MLSGNYQCDNEDYEDALESYQYALYLLENKHPKGLACKDCLEEVRSAVNRTKSLIKV